MVTDQHAQPEYETVELPLLALDVPHMRTCLHQWDRARHGRPTASEREAKPLSIADAAGFTGLIDVVPAPLDFRFRYFGSQMATGQGIDYTGHLVSEVRPPGYAAAIRVGYEVVLRDRRPVFEHVRFNDEARKRSYFRLLMPLSDCGDAVNTIWAVTHYYQGPWQPIRP